MPSKQVYDQLLAKGFPVDKLIYLKYDSLESNSDLELLFEVLTSFKDINGNHPVITANVVMTNPDFDKIRESEFKNYYYELFINTLKRYPEHDRVYDLYKKGIMQRIFYPQLHGLEHLNVRRWMNSLQRKDSNSRKMFDYRLFDLSISHTNITKDSFMDSLSPENLEEIMYEKHSLLKAAELFNKTFGFSAITFIAPCYIWRPELEPVFSKMGIKVIQSGMYQLVPKIGRVNKFSKKFHYTGQKNNYGQKYTVRNCFFEPSFNSHNHNIVESCLTQIERSFKIKSQAIISSQVNYIGFIEKSNQQANLKKLEDLIQKILIKWPTVEFLTSEELARILI